MIIRDRHIEGTPLTPLTLLRHVHVKLAEFGIPDRQLGIRHTFLPELTMRFLSGAPLHVGHIWCGVGGDVPIASEAVNDPAHLAADPPEHGMELHIGAFSTISCHTNLLETI